MGGLRAARRKGIQTGGYMPLGWRTEYGPRPNYKDWFGMDEWLTEHYEDRTEQNVIIGDGTVIFGRRSPGSNKTEECCRIKGKPCLWIPDTYTAPKPNQTTKAVFIKWVNQRQIQILNVAGNRESINLGIEFRVEDFLVEVL